MAEGCAQQVQAVLVPRRLEACQQALAPRTGVYLCSYFQWMGESMRCWWCEWLWHEVRPRLYMDHCWPRCSRELELSTAQSVEPCGITHYAVSIRTRMQHSRHRT